MVQARLALSILVLVGCRDATGKQPEADPAAGSAGSGSAAIAPVTPTSTDDYVPAEFRSGMARWKDTGVYLDGKPIAFMSFGELPIALQPTWVKEKASQDKPAG